MPIPSVERERRLTSVRAVPLPKSWTAPGGTCRWCNKKIRHAVTRELLRRRRWHEECVRDYNFCRNPMAGWVLGKSGHRCAGCDSSLRCWSHEPTVREYAKIPDYQTDRYLPPGSRYSRLSWKDRFRNGVEGDLCPVLFEPLHWTNHLAEQQPNGYTPWHHEPAGGPYCAVTPCHLKYEIDHIVPLWSVDRTLPWAKLIVHWRLGNCQALCDPCHKRKTAAEARERHARRRNAGQQALAL